MLFAALLGIQPMSPPPSIVPRPVTVELTTGQFVLGPKTKIAVNGPARLLADTIRNSLAASTGYPLNLTPRGGQNTINIAIDPKLGGLGTEGYRLDVQPDRIEIRAAQPAGAFYGIQTLRQLLPADVFRKAPGTPRSWTVPCLHIEDRPRFAWRGAHMDVCRHFMAKDFVLKYIDLLAMHKMNVFHWHLTDDQGWRIEIKRYPKLTEVGAWRKDSMITYSPPTFEGRPHGGFYSQDDIREVVAYAAQRFVTVVPEIEMPGHAQAAIAAYPELGNTTRQLAVSTQWGVIEDVFNVEDSTVTFLQNVLTEVMELFPSKFIHIGGDEVPKDQWKKNPRAQAKMKQLGLKDEHELQSWFIRQMDAFLASKGRRLIGWDEILEGGLAPGAAVMSWRGEGGGIAAAKAGHDVVMTPTGTTYLDYYQSKDTKKEPLAIGGYVPLSTVYGYEPVPKELTEAEAAHVLGAQGQLWTEYIPTSQQLEYMAYPRLCALSEVVWSPAAGKSYPDFLKRLAIHVERLRAFGVNFRKLDTP